MKNVLLIGLGRFGRHLAMQLSELGHQVMAVDRDEERVNECMPFVTNAQIGDSTRVDFLRSLGVGNYDVCTHRLHLRRYRMQSKVILSATVILIALPALLFFLTDFAKLPAGQRVLASLFQAVTPRTAGYNTADLTKMSDTSQAVTILLMLTGGAPGSTAGGMKVTTLAVLAANAVAAFRRREDPQLFKRRLEPSAVRNAAAILLLYLGLTFASAAVISAAENLPLGACLYETASAAGTVGLTLGLTPQLGTLSQGILILLMFFGRVGGLTLIYAAFSGHDLTYARYPKEMITVG